MWLLSPKRLWVVVSSIFFTLSFFSAYCAVIVANSERWLYFMIYDTAHNHQEDANNCSYFQTLDTVVSSASLTGRVAHIEGIREGICQNDIHFLSLILSTSLSSFTTTTLATISPSITFLTNYTYYKFIVDVNETNEFLGHIEFFPTHGDCSSLSASTNSFIPVKLPSQTAILPFSYHSNDNQSLIVNGCIDNSTTGSIALKYLQGPLSDISISLFSSSIVVQEK